VRQSAQSCTAIAVTRERNPTVNDRYWFLVLEESLPEGTIAEHRKERRPKPKRPSPSKRQRQPTDQYVIRTSARSRRSS
jgi:hypothetical protein